MELVDKLKGLVLEQGGRVVAPILVKEGWQNIPEGFRAEACAITFPAKSELKALAATTGTEIDDKAIAEWYEQAEKWSGEQEGGRWARVQLGDGTTLSWADACDLFCKIGK